MITCPSLSLSTLDKLSSSSQSSTSLVSVYTPPVRIDAFLLPSCSIALEYRSRRSALTCRRWSLSFFSFSWSFLRLSLSFLRRVSPSAMRAISPPVASRIACRSAAAPPELTPPSGRLITTGNRNAYEPPTMPLERMRAWNQRGSLSCLESLPCLKMLKTMGHKISVRYPTDRIPRLTPQ